MLNTVSVCCELNFSKLLPHSELKYTFFLLLVEISLFYMYEGT